MRSISIFVEGGGGTNATGRGELRVAFDVLLRDQKEAARKRPMKWNTIFCGSRDETANKFAQAIERKEADLVVLVVDAEDAVVSSTPSHPTPSERLRHLKGRDGWAGQLKDAKPEQVHLMTKCMEAWLIADGEKLAKFYGQRFQSSALPQRRILDEELKDTLLAALKKASKDTQKGTYGKIKHASALLKLVRPEMVAKRCISFQQLTQWLDAAIAEA